MSKILDHEWPNELPPDDVFDRYARRGSTYSCRRCGASVEWLATVTHDAWHEEHDHRR